MTRSSAVAAVAVVAAAAAAGVGAPVLAVDDLGQAVGAGHGDELTAVAGTDSLADIVNRKHWRAGTAAAAGRTTATAETRARTGHPRAAGHARFTTAIAAISCAI